MRLRFLFTIFLFSVLGLHAERWIPHMAYNDMQQVVVAGDEVYVLSGGHIYSLNKYTERPTFYTLQDGFVGNNVASMYYDASRQSMLFFYANGYVDVKSSAGIHTVSDMHATQTLLKKTVQAVARKDDMLYLGMPYGVQTFSLPTLSFVDSYVLGPEGAEWNIKSVAVVGNELYAATDSAVRHVNLQNNPVDYRSWEQLPAVPNQKMKALADRNGVLVGLWGTYLYTYQSGEWQQFSSVPMSSLIASESHLLAIGTSGGIYDLSASSLSVLAPEYAPMVAAYDASLHDYWMADNTNGLMHLTTTGVQQFVLNAPGDNMPYRLNYCHDKLFVLPGGRWASQYNRPARISMFEDGQWTNLSPDQLRSQAGIPMTDLMSVAAPDSSDLSHFFASSYGLGIFEFQNNAVVNHWDATNSNLTDLSAVDPYHYTRVDGLQFDSHGNLWCVNEHIRMLPSGATWNDWLDFPLLDVKGNVYPLNTPTPPVLMADSGCIWVATCRSTTGLGVYDYAGTLMDRADDRTVHRTEFVDADGGPATFEFIYSCEKDKEGNLWLATTSGVYYTSREDFFATGTLHHVTVDGEHFLAGERVNCIAVSEDNRKWIGTENLGVYLLGADNSLLMHYTTANSALPSNAIVSIAINPVTGVVMFGSSDGLAEYDENATSALPSAYDEDLMTEDYSGMMNGWTFHFAYSGVSEVAALGDRVFGLADGALFSVDVVTEEVRTHNALNGLSGSDVGHIVSDGHGRLLIAYTDGNIDILSDEGIVNITDLKRKQLTGVSKLLNDAFYSNGKMYLAMSFGVLVLDMRKAEFSDWYQPLSSGYPALERLEVRGDSLFAASATTLYSACLRDNLVDFAFWKAQPLAARPDIVIPCHILSEVSLANCTYLAAGEQGILRRCGDVEVSFLPNGPEVNMPYSMSVLGNKLMMVPGGRWASDFLRPGVVMTYENGSWSNISNKQLLSQIWMNIIRDFTRVAIDPTRPNHYAISAYGCGVFEFEDDHITNLYYFTNSPLESAVPGAEIFVRTDGALYDPEGYLWVLNAASTTCMKVLAPSGQWALLSVKNGSTPVALNTPGDVMLDKRHPNYRWLVSTRSSAGLGLIDHAGTPMLPGDDRSVFRTDFVQVRAGKTYSIKPNAIFAIEQDHEGNTFVGTGEGFFCIPASVDFFQSNKCVRPAIVRDDGSLLGDFMLATEQINDIAVDGGNRVWFATAGSGVYLMQVDLNNDDLNKTIYHFTTKNSPLPSDNVLSLAILPITGEVFFGTEKGVVSFRSDANEPAEDYTSAYAFPNPVRPDFQGVVTVTGLVDNSSVIIADAAGNTILACRSNGGMAVWDMRDRSGRRVTPGVYTIFCNAAGEDGESKHAKLKVLIM